MKAEHAGGALAEPWDASELNPRPGENCDLAAEYAYDAFGNTIYEDGDMADVFPHRFSTKYYDAETDLYYYGYRYYSPRLGRWISRDPIEEEGGWNLYQCCLNNMIDGLDYLGEIVLIFEGASYVPSTNSNNPTLEGKIQVGRLFIWKFLRKALMVSPTKWTKLQSEGKILFNDKPFSGTRSEYLMGATREMLSFVIRPSSSDFQKYLDQLAIWYPKANQPYDIVVVAIHGERGSYAPTGRVVFMGDRQMKQSDAISRILNVFIKGPQTPARKEIVSCFRFFKPPKRNSPQDWQQALRDSEESFEIIPAYGDVNDCEIYFNSFEIMKK